MLETFAYQPPKNEVPLRKRKKVLPVYSAMTERAAILAGLLKGWEYDTVFAKGERTLVAHTGEVHDISDIPGNVLHVIVVAEPRKRKDGYRREFYLGAFEGRSQLYTSAYPVGPEEREEHGRKMSEIATRAHRVPVNDLEELIENVIVKFKAFSEQRQLNSQTNTQG